MKHNYGASDRSQKLKYDIRTPLLIIGVNTSPRKARKPAANWN